MNEASRVLLIGDHPGHMAVKAQVLQHFWGVASQVVPADGTMSEVQPGGYEVAVVCSTLPDEVRQQWVDRVRESAPGLLIVKLNGYDSGPHANADATVDESHGPAALVSTIYELLNERGLPSRPWPEPDGPGWVQ